MFLCLQFLSRRWTPGGQWIGKNRRVVKLSRTQKLTAAQKERDIQKVKVDLPIHPQVGVIVLCLIFIGVGAVVNPLLDSSRGERAFKRTEV